MDEVDIIFIFFFCCFVIYCLNGYMILLKDNYVMGVGIMFDRSWFYCLFYVIKRMLNLIYDLYWMMKVGLKYLRDK